MSERKLWTPENGLAIDETHVKPTIREIPYIHSIADGQITVDTIENVVDVDGKPIEDMELKVLGVLATLAEQPDTLITNWELTHRVWGNYDYDKRDSSIRVAIRKLRRKLGPELGDVNTGAIRNVPKIGTLAVSSLDDDTRIQNVRENLYSLRIADDRIEIIPDSHLVIIDDKISDRFTKMQFNLLAYLALKPDELKMYQEILLEVWGSSEAFKSRSLFSTIRTVRRKLGPELGDVNTGAIRTKLGHGLITLGELNR